MKILLSYARSMFWTIGVLTAVLSVPMMVSRLQHPPHLSQPAAQATFGVLEVCFFLFMIGVGVVTCLAARALKKQGRFARTLVVFASLYSLILFPFGTVAGAVGLYWCLSRKVREMEPLVDSFDYQSKTGDGTQKWIQGAISIASIVIMLGSLGIATWWGQKHGLPRHTRFNGLLLLFLCEWIAVFFHELGHAVAGYLSGMRPVMFSVGPFMAHKRMNRWKFGFTLAALVGAGGGVVSVPRHLGNLRRRMAVEIAAGPVASLLTAILAMAVLSNMSGSAWVMWWKVPAMVAAISAGGVLLNLIPFRSAAGFSDGALLVQLLVGGPFADMREVLKIIGATKVSALRPRDVDRAALSRGVQASTGDSIAGIFHMMETICAVDRGDLRCARASLDSAMATLSTPEKVNDPATAAEIAFYLVYLDGHEGRAGRWLRDSEAFAVKKKVSLTGEFDYWLSVAAVRLAERRMAEANDACRRAQQLADSFPKVGLYEYQKDLLNTVREHISVPPEAPAQACLPSSTEATFATR